MSGSQPPYQDPEAFCLLYGRAYLPVFRYIYGLRGGPIEEVEDVAADTFIHAWKSRQRFQGSEDAALGWLLKIARNLVIDGFRRSRSATLEVDVEDLEIPTSASGPEEQTTLQEQARILAALLQDLPDDEREMVVLRYLLDWPVYKIAGHLNMLENTVSVTIKRALVKVRNGWPD